MKMPFQVIRSILVGVAFLAVTVLLMMWLAGAFHRKIDRADAERAVAVDARRPVDEGRLVVARRIRVPRYEYSVGTIRAVNEAAVAAKLLARIVDVSVTAGQSVTEGDVLVRLDDRDLKARLEQAQSAVAGARAAREQANIEYERVKKLFADGAAAPIEWDRVQTQLKSADAELARTEHAANEARTIMDYATIVSPISGVVIDKKVNVGDTATPGQVLLTLYDPTHMQLLASVRESLTRRLTVGQTVDVEIDAIQRRCQGRVSEIVPEAEAASRTFSVKVTGPCPPGIYSGMFGRLLIPLDEEDVLVIPRQCVRRIGQMDIVHVAAGGSLQRRAVQLGRAFGGDVEVLSGLAEGERVESDAAGGVGEPR
jgi:RND family efflux transporter MFP subunit